MKRVIRASSVLLASALVLCTPPVARAQAKPAKPGFNLFSVEQDVEIGRQSAVEAERQLPMLRNGNVDRYLNKIVTKLAAQAPGARYPYAIKAVNASEINAFSLPGGPMYVNRGLFEAASGSTRKCAPIHGRPRGSTVLDGSPPLSSAASAVSAATSEMISEAL